MSRFEGKLQAAAEAPDASDLLAALVAQAKVESGDRNGAIARCLSASEDWRDASELLGGAFANGSARTAPDDQQEE